MNTVTLNPQQETKEFDLINDDFIPSEALDIVSPIIDSNVNFYKVQNWRNWEGNHKLDTQNFDQKTAELAALKNSLQEAVAHAKQAGCKLRIESSFKITMVK